MLSEKVRPKQPSLSVCGVVMKKCSKAANNKRPLISPGSENTSEQGYPSKRIIFKKVPVQSD